MLTFVMDCKTHVIDYMRLTFTLNSCVLSENKMLVQG